MTDHPSRTLATFASQLRFDSIPPHVVEPAVDLYVDCRGPALSGKDMGTVPDLVAHSVRR